MNKKWKGFEKKLLLAIPYRSILKAKEGKNAKTKKKWKKKKNEKNMKNNEKQMNKMKKTWKGFEKKLLLAIP